MGQTVRLINEKKNNDSAKEDVHPGIPYLGSSTYLRKDIYQNRPQIGDKLLECAKEYGAEDGAHDAPQPPYDEHAHKPDGVPQGKLIGPHITENMLVRFQPELPMPK